MQTNGQGVVPQVEVVHFNKQGVQEERTETMYPPELMAELERLKAENAKLKATNKRGITLKVSEKGGLSVYGLQRFPITMYLEQWEAIGALFTDGTIPNFIKEHRTELKTREDAPKTDK